MTRTFRVIFQGSLDTATATAIVSKDKQRLSFLECTLQILIDQVLTVTYTIDTSDTVILTPPILAETSDEFITARAQSNLWLEFIARERSGGLSVNPAKAIGITSNVIVETDEIRFEMKRDTTRLTEGVVDIPTKSITFQTTDIMLSMSFSEFLLWNRLLDTVAESIKSL